MLHGSFHVLGFGLAAMIKSLKKDGTLTNPKTLLQICHEVGSLIYNVGPYLLRALLPRYNPRCDKDPQWQIDWVRGHAELPPDSALPLLDTSDPDIPVPFSK